MDRCSPLHGGTPIFPIVLFLLATFTEFPYLQNRFQNWLLVGVLTPVGLIFYVISGFFTGILNANWSLAGPLLIIPYAVLGLAIIIITLAIFTLHTWRNRKTATPRTKAMALTIGLPATAMLTYFAYVPAGPDVCSRHLTDTRYSACLMEVFQDMPVNEVQRWLEEQGHKVTVSRYYADLGSKLSPTQFDKRYGKYGKFQDEIILHSSRRKGFGKSIPYGTNFNRLFGRLPPAPSYFELDIRAREKSDRVIEIKAHWAFTFL